METVPSFCLTAMGFVYSVQHACGVCLSRNDYYSPADRHIEPQKPSCLKQTPFGKSGNALLSFWSVGIHTYQPTALEVFPMKIHSHVYLQGNNVDFALIRRTPLLRGPPKKQNCLTKRQPPLISKVLQIDRKLALSGWAFALTNPLWPRLVESLSRHSASCHAGCGRKQTNMTRPGLFPIKRDSAFTLCPTRMEVQRPLSFQKHTSTSYFII